MSAAPYGKAKFRVILNLGGTATGTPGKYTGGREYEICRATTDFSLNAIPQAEAQLAVGREIRSLKPATINTAGQQLAIMQTAQIYLTASGNFSPTEQWPSSQQMIFDGYLTGSAYEKRGNSTALTMSFTHWLSDLSYSTMLSDSSHPGNPHDYTYQAAYLPPEVAGLDGEAAKPGLLSRANALPFFSVDNINADLFGKAILPFFKALAQTDRMLFEGKLNPCWQAGAQRTNNIALAALNRFESGTQNPWNVPLAVITGDAAAKIAQSISDGMMSRLDDGAYFQSFWDNLIGRIATDMFFGVVPRVNSALVAPIIPGLQKTYSRTIQDTDQDYVSLQATIPRMIRAVGVAGFDAIGVYAGHSEAGTEAIPDTGIGGCYLAVDANGKPLTKGSLLVVMAPSWLSSIGLVTTPINQTIGVNSATTPAGNNGPKGANPPGVVARSTDSQALYSAYAKSYYLGQVLQGRQGIVGGKLRFDIAPGTNVFIEGTSDKFLGPSDKVGQDLIGMVTRVSCALDSEMEKASTGFNVAYARTEAENNSPQTSSNIHPLYNAAFVGAPLIDGYAMTS